MILGIIFSLMFVVGFILSAIGASDKNDDLTMFITGLIICVISFLGILTFIYINADIIYKWFRM